MCSFGESNAIGARRFGPARPAAKVDELCIGARPQAKRFVANGEVLRGTSGRVQAEALREQGASVRVVLRSEKRVAPLEEVLGGRRAIGRLREPRCTGSPRRRRPRRSREGDGCSSFACRRLVACQRFDEAGLAALVAGWRASDPTAAALCVPAAVLPAGRNLRAEGAGAGAPLDGDPVAGATACGVTSTGTVGGGHTGRRRRRKAARCRQRAGASGRRCRLRA